MDDQISKEESLRIIQKMITEARSSVTDSGLSWLLWGSMIFLASLSTFIFININAENTFLGWNIFGVIALILLVYDIAKPKKKTVKTYAGELLSLVDIGFIICLFTSTRFLQGHTTIIPLSFVARSTFSYSGISCNFINFLS